MGMGKIVSYFRKEKFQFRIKQDKKIKAKNYFVLQ